MRERNLNISEAAQLLGVDPGTLKRWVEREALEPATNSNYGPMRFKRNDIEAFARKSGISLERDRHHPDHFTPPTLAAAINAGEDASTSTVTATTIRQMIASKKIKTLKVPCSSNRVTLMIDQAEGLRVIELFTRARPKAG